MKILKRIVIPAILAISMLAAAGCSRPSLGRETQDGLNAFNSIVKSFPGNKGFHMELSHWGFKLPTGEKFEWTKDTSANKADFAMVMLADPFIEAGLDVNRLDANEWLFEPAAREGNEELPNRLIKLYNVSDRKADSSGSEDAMRRLLLADSGLLKYHKEQQHYRLILGDGFEVQWTEKLGINDADMIFALEAEPLVKAGLDADKLDGSGWVFMPAGQGPMGMGENPDQLVKIYRLK